MKEDILKQIQKLNVEKDSLNNLIKGYETPTAIRYEVNIPQTDKG